jgi:nucleoside-diphosphate-sugar epimerase
MSRVVVIGATGHIGTYLVPRLVDGGHEVIAISRGTRGPYHDRPQWDTVTRVTADREAEDAAGMFGRRIAALHPEVVIDLICFSAGSARQLLEELRPSRPLLVHCGTIWVHGQALRVPVTEDEPRTAYGEYGTGPSTPRSPASTRPAASPPASPARARYSGTRRATPRSTPCARPWPGSPPTARQM